MGVAALSTAIAMVLLATVQTAASDVPHYDRVLQLEQTSETSANVSIGDVNKDGNLDIVLAKGRHWPLVDRVLLGDGKGGIASAYDLGVASDRSYSARLADMDGDGDLDVVVSNDAPDPKRIYLNDGKGRFRAGPTFGRPEWPTRNASIADLNNDGRLDIVLANRANGRLANYVCLNNGIEKFGTDCQPFSTESATTITPADINGDGAIDLIVPHRDGGQSYVYMNRGGARFPVEARLPFGPPHTKTRMAEAADMDGDGKLDLVAIAEQAGLAVHFGDGNGDFPRGHCLLDASYSPNALALADLNGDNAVDIVVGFGEETSEIFINRGNGRDYIQYPLGNSWGTVYGFAIADLDKNGLPDIAVARSGAPNVVYFGDR